MIPSVHRWLSFRIRALCVGVFVLGSLIPPFIPQTALSQEDDELQEMTDSQFLFVEDGFLMKTSSLGEGGSRLAYSEGLLHTVQTGESVESLAAQYSISVETIRTANSLQPGVEVKPGGDLVILPVDGVLHTVKRGQTLTRIAQLYNVSEESISRQNRIENGFIIAGQQLIVPGAKPLPPSETVADTEGPLRFATKFSDKTIVLKGGASKAELAIATAKVNLPLPGGELGMPCGNCFYTQGYRAGHYAVDIQTRGGGPIYAAEAGTVIRADTGWNGGYGSVIEVDHGNGLVTLYAHNKTLYVDTGDTISRGQHIADMGNTGLVHGPTGIHIHFEVRVNGVKKNPKLYLP